MARVCISIDKNIYLFIYLLFSCFYIYTCEIIDLINIDFNFFKQKFLEGLFQNQSHCKEFLKAEEGLSILLKYYSLPTVPYDFESSQASYSLSNQMRLIIDVETKRSVIEIINNLNSTLQYV